MSTPRLPRATGSLLTRAFGGTDGKVRLVAGLTFLGVVCSQHPNPVFDRVQRLDPLSSVFPNWRFFAPTPAQHDFQFYYRTLDEAGETSDWTALEVIQGRRARQFLWFPERRSEKAVYDLGSEILRVLDRGFEVAVTLPSFRILRRFFREEIGRSGTPDVKGFQFALIRSSGYDEAEEPEIIFLSPYTPMRETAAPARESETV
ncbi:hypothetical protein [Streptomyces sp. SID8352]|uniref:hypothetical protein n=1 Tax=Streptomyces sp. SID8352 TaxID=2690338 RepID=UPI001368BB24|nr:hypothetical protein [Streptomyces sp. SID8352]MYU26019.1 hypothetical protein [Streptomyces sp. SID8352]